jgi:uncharacterized protein DUF4236
MNLSLLYFVYSLKAKGRKMALQFSKRLNLTKGMYLNLSQSGVSMSVGIKGWRRALAMGLAGASMLGAPMKAHGQEWWQATAAQAEQAITQAWSQLSPNQKQELRQEEREWIKWKDSLPADRRTWATADRAHYLQAYRKGGKDAADKSLYHTFSGDFITADADGKLTFDPAAATQKNIRSYDMHAESQGEPTATPTPTPPEQLATASRWTKDGNVDRAWGELPFVCQVDLVGADLLGAQ